MNYIVQGSNNPLKIEFYNVEGFESSVVSLWADDVLLKQWDRSNIRVKDNALYCALSQEETMNFPPGKALLEIKWTYKGETYFADRISILILDRFDRRVI